MRKRKDSNKCFYFKEENGICKHYGGDTEKIEACYTKCKHKSNRKNEVKKNEVLEKCITGVVIE